MMYSRWILAALMLAAPLFAEDAEKTKKKGKVIPAMPIIGAAAKAPADAAAEIKKLTDEFNKATQAFFQPWRDARAKGEKYQLDYSKHPRIAYSKKFTELAKKFAGQDAAVDAWIMALRTGGNRDAALTVLLRDHIASKKMIDIVRFLGSGKGSAERLLKLVEQSPHREVQGYALLVRGEALLKSGDKSAERVLTEVVEKYGDVPIYGGRSTAGKKAAGALFEARNLKVGTAAPEIEGEDIDGVVFKLSDYRGKVILLDFWGDW